MTEDCKNCRAMKVLEEMERRLYRGEEIHEALQGALNNNPEISCTPLKPKHLATGTCLKPGCNLKIHYDPDAKEKPLYCKKHMPEYVGRNTTRIRNHHKDSESPSKGCKGNERQRAMFTLERRKEFEIRFS
jgi:hypothetical protein